MDWKPMIREELEELIPSAEYWCNQDELSWALPALAGKSGVQLGPPEPIS